MWARREFFVSRYGNRPTTVGKWAIYRGTFYCIWTVLRMLCRYFILFKTCEIHWRIQPVREGEREGSAREGQKPASSMKMVAFARPNSF